MRSVLRSRRHRGQSLSDIVTPTVDTAQFPELTDALRDDVALVASLPIVQQVLDACSRDTGLRFAAVARVTEEHWVACRSNDALDFGVGSGDQLPVRTTLCAEVLAGGGKIAFDDAAADARYANHPFPATYGFRSYISVPLALPDGEVFGTLCAHDVRPARVANDRTVERFTLYAELLSLHIDTARRLENRSAELASERRDAELREQFVAVLGHDLRNPLAAIDLNAQLIEAVAAQQEVVGASLAIGRSVQRMNELIGNLLDLARAQRGDVMRLQIAADSELVDRLHGVVDELVLVYPAHRVETRLTAYSELPCDADRVAQLLSNLLGNALQHGSSERPVVVETSVADGRFRLVVDNAGPPIPPATLARLFRPFLRGDERDDTAGAMAGLGLGLYIAHGIAVAHGGTLSCRSDADGTRFTFEMAAGGAPSSPDGAA